MISVDLERHRSRVLPPERSVETGDPARLIRQVAAVLESSTQVRKLPGKDAADWYLKTMLSGKASYLLCESPVSPLRGRRESIIVEVSEYLREHVEDNQRRRLNPVLGSSCLVPKPVWDCPLYARRNANGAIRTGSF